MKNRTLKVFVGYQIKSKFHLSGNLKKVMSKKIASAIRSKLGLNLVFKFGDKFNAGESLFTQVQEAINDCEIAIFDISENNPNVMIEVGMAMGAKKFTILLKNKASNEFPVPSDLKAFIYIPYNRMEAIVSDVKKAIVNYTKNLIPSHFYYKQLWGFNSNDIVYIVCPELDEPEKRQNPEPNEFLYLGKYGDIDSLITLLISLSKLYPHINFRTCTSKEFKANRFCNSENLLLLGGPDYNLITRNYMKNIKKIPYKFVEVNDDDMGLKIPKKKIAEKANIQFEDLICNGHDYGFFIKLTNPANNKKKVIMINGIHTYGVYGAAKCFSINSEGENDVSLENCKKVVSRAGDNGNFATYFKVPIMENVVQIPKIVIKEIRAL